MTRVVVRGTVAALSVLLVTAGLSCRSSERGPGSATSTRTPSAHGTIKGHVRLAGLPPQNEAIRMRADPMCDKANSGKRVLQQAVVAGADGSLANVFVQLQGSFPDAPMQTDPVVVDQVGCVYVPRVVGVQIGQPLEIRNSDPGLHNVHATAAGSDGFNVGQATAGASNTFKLTTDGMTRLQCDVHTWMLAFVHVVRHPYFAVTGDDGTFELRNVPIGVHNVHAWHERYGSLTTSVRVDLDSVAPVEFTYTESANSVGNAR